MPESEKNAAAEKAAELVLPAVQPPITKAPATLNQQVNIYQMPQPALDKLSGDQIFELSKQMMTQMDIADKRQFDFATQDAEQESGGRKLAICCGTAIALVAIIAITLLTIKGHEIVALGIALPLGTILAVIVGNRFID